jgi:hypothetical protein
MVDDLNGKVQVPSLVGFAGGEYALMHWSKLCRFSIRQTHCPMPAWQLFARLWSHDIRQSSALLAPADQQGIDMQS